MYGICDGIVSVLLTSDLGTSRKYILGIVQDILPNKTIKISIDGGIPVDKFFTVQLQAEYNDKGVLCLLAGPSGWSGMVLSDVRVTYDLKSLPNIAVVMPVHGVDEETFCSALDSVVAQSYPHWVLCAFISDDEPLGIKEVLEEFEKENPEKTRIARSTSNVGISASTNAAISVAPNGTKIYSFFDCDDELHPDALINVAKVFSDRNDVSVVYTDEDKIESDGRLVEAHYKPGFSREMLLSQNYMCHLVSVSDKVIAKCGQEPLDGRYDGAQDHEFLLRCTFDPNTVVVHIPKVLYHWRKSGGSSAKDSSAKLWAFDAGLKAVMSQCDTGALVYRGPYLGTYRVRKPVDDWPDVHIIIPTHDNIKMFGSCLQSLGGIEYRGKLFVHVLAHMCSDSTFDILIGMKDKELLSTLQRYEGEFNWSAINNSAVDSVFYAKEGCPELHKSAVVFMNDDIEAVDPYWLDEMIRELWQPGVGIVGAKLLYPDMRIQHAGVVIGMGGIAGHGHKRLADSNSGYFCRHHLVQQMSAVTGACMAVKVEVFLGVGGFEEKLPKAFNDVDFCLRVREAGYKVVYTPWARLVHHESFSRGVDAGDDPVFQAAIKYMEEKWHCRTYQDPFFNPNLDITSEIFRGK
jgi:GT2 family glycosyltransferase